MRLPFRFVLVGVPTIAVCFEIIRSNTSLSFLSCVAGAIAVVAPIYLLINLIASLIDQVIPRFRQRFAAAALPGERKLKLFQLNLGTLFFVQAVAAFFYLVQINTDLDIVSSALISVAAALFFRVFFDLPFFLAIGVEWIVRGLFQAVELDGDTTVKPE